MATDMIYPFLLTTHILAGAVALFGAFIAITTKLFDLAHKWHVLGGRAFFIGMMAVFLTALPMTYLKPNLFLFLIAIFSFYLPYTGWRYATNRTGKPNIADWGVLVLMCITATGLIGWGARFSWLGDNNGITLIVFGVIGLSLTVRDYQRFKKGPLKGKDRISAHLTMMMAAAIAAITAFLVTNIQTNPEWITWLAPTVVITPIIIWMNKRLYTGQTMIKKSRKLNSTDQ